MTLQEAYRRGFQAALVALAVWQDGEQVVGVQRRPLREAVASPAHVYGRLYRDHEPQIDEVPEALCQQCFEAPPNRCPCCPDCGAMGPDDCVCGG